MSLYTIYKSNLYFIRNFLNSGSILINFRKEGWKNRSRAVGSERRRSSGRGLRTARQHGNKDAESHKECASNIEQRQKISIPTNNRMEGQNK